MTFQYLLTKAELEALLKAYARESKQKTASLHHAPAECKRDKAIILFLLDTGLRASEFSHLKIRDVDMKNGRDDLDAPLLVSRGERPFNPDSLRHRILRIAEIAGVKNVHLLHLR